MPAALWRKERLGELQSADAEVLAAAFEPGYHGTDGEAPAFAAVALASVVVETAAQVTATTPCAPDERRATTRRSHDSGRRVDRPRAASDTQPTDVP